MHGLCSLSSHLPPTRSPLPFPDSIVHIHTTGSTSAKFPKQQYLTTYSHCNMYVKAESSQRNNVLGDYLLRPRNDSIFANATTSKPSFLPVPGLVSHCELWHKADFNTVLL